MPVARRIFLKAGLAVVLAGISQPAVSEILGSNEVSKSRKEAIISAQARLGANLIRKLASDKKGDANIVISPASLASIFSFIELGSGDDMRRAIHRTLGFRPAAKARASQEIKELRGQVTATIARNIKDGPLNLANLLVFDPSTKPRELALLGVSGAGADVLVDDLSAPETLDRINQWVRQRTHDLIPSIIEETPATLGLVAINALYFKDNWKTPFDAARTRATDFKAASGATANVMMMHSPVAKYAFRQNERFIAAELNYANDDFKMIVVTTKSEPAKASEFASVASWLQGKEFEIREGEIALPRLAISVNEEMLGPLDGLGLRSARLARGSLEGFSPVALSISRVVQKLELRVDEKGTEAAAATAVIATRSLAVSEHVKMVVDKPFMFALRDQRTGFVLFMGYVGSPQKLTAGK